MKRAAEAASRLSVEHLWVLVIVIGIIAFLNTQPVPPNDFWWHMAVGKEILATHHIPQVDVYSFTAPGAPYPSYQQFWLMEVVLYTVYRLGGLVAVILFQMVIVASAYLVVLSLCYRRSLNWRAAAAGLLFAAALGFGNWNVRPQAITYLYAALFLAAIDHLQRKPGRLVWLVFPVVMLLWVNSHGTFPIGFAILGIWGLDRLAQVFREHARLKFGWDFHPLLQPVLASLGALLGCLVNPTGLGFVRYFSNMAGNPVLQNFTTEWMPPGFDTLDGTLFLISLLLLAVILAVSPKRPSLASLLSFLVFAFLGLKYVRGVVWFGLILAPLVAEHCAALSEQWGMQPEDRRAPSPAARRMNLLLAGMLLLLALLSLPWFKQYLPLTADKVSLAAPYTPIAATNYMLTNDLPVNVYHDMAFGSYFIWAAQPKYKVFVDSRIELYPVQVWQDYLLIGNAGTGWEEKLAQYQVRTMVLKIEDRAELIRAAQASGHWQQVYADPYVMILTQKGN